MNWTASQVKNNFGQALEEARREPVTITKDGRPAVAMLDIAEYQRLRGIEDRYWIARAEEAEASGYLTPEETMSLLSEGLRSAAKSESEGGV